MAKEQRQCGQYRKLLMEQQGQRPEEKEPVSFFRLRFYLCLCLFIGYLILDITKGSFYNIDSGRISAEISKDMTENLNFKETFRTMTDSITKEIYIK